MIERLQGDIDRLQREKKLLKLQHEESEKASETLATRNQQLQDRNSIYEQSHEANKRALERKERQFEELKEEVRREKVKAAQAEEQARLAATNEDKWREQANQAKAIASQRESEYDTIVACRNMDNDRHQAGLNRIKRDYVALIEQREDDLEKHKKLEIIAEQQKQTISQLEELTQRLSTNFRAYRTEIDTAIADLRRGCDSKDTALADQLREMTAVTGEMRWVMNVEKEVNHRPVRPYEPPAELHSAEPPTPRSPSKFMFNVDVKGKHRRKGSTKVSK